MTTAMPMLDHRPLERPAPPTAAMLAALRRRPDAPALVELGGSNPFFRFDYKRRYSDTYANKHRLVLREEHYPELARLAQEFNLHRPKGEFPASPSDIVNACLDFALEHPLCMATLGSTTDIREHLAREVYRRAFFRFMRLYENG